MTDTPVHAQHVTRASVRAASRAVDSQDHISEITERAGASVTSEQILRNYSRYAWARQYCRDQRVLELACGTGQGLGMLVDVAQNVIAVDIDAEHIKEVRRRYGTRTMAVLALPSALPLPPASVDAVVILEALYFFPDPDAVIKEALRVMHRPGSLLLSCPNKDIRGFAPSPYGVKYFGAPDLRAYLETFGLNVSVFGDYPVNGRGLGERVRILLKSAATNMGIFPHSVRAKNILKRMFVGALQKMPDVFTYGSYDITPPFPLKADSPDLEYKILFVRASIN
jgi:SAM-dependent methyltransferase